VGFSQALTAGLAKSHCQISPKGSHPGKISLLSLPGDGTAPPSMHCGLSEITAEPFHKNRGMVRDRRRKYFACCIPRIPRKQNKGNSLCFFCLAGAPLVYLAERIRSSPARRQEGTRRAWGLGESAPPGRLFPCQQSKTVSLKLWRRYAAITPDNLH
jgi:hypothetical protein